MSASSLAGIILAAGKGTRMKSELPKGLFEVCGLPMVELIGRAMREAGVEKPTVVVGHQRELMQHKLGDAYGYAVQDEQHGTGHAAQMAAPMLNGHHGGVLIVPGDTPLLSGEALRLLAEHHRNSGAACTIATVIMADPAGYGRIVRREDSGVGAIVEHKDAPEHVRENVKEINSGVYIFDAAALTRLLPQLSNQNAQGEYYLTDLIKAINDEGGRVEALPFDDPDMLMGVNDRWQLAQAAAALRQRILKKHALNGVSIIDPSTTYIGADVSIGQDTVIKPMTSISGLTNIGSGCDIGPSTDINDCEIGNNVTIVMSKLDHATMRDGSRCGPYAHLRLGATIGEGAKIGNYVEVKNAVLGKKAAAAHLTYLGDANIGAGTNVGAGTITCNYDGFGKHRTEIGENVFVGSNSTLVAPITIGEGALIAAGSVITQDVPADALGVGRGRQEVKEQWAARWRQKKKAEREAAGS
jgi:bifunctional UDP-N-acetylglucosamine pyrophosphorylase / glucosamine-1-phosphate N-acetyltransferase